MTAPFAIEFDELDGGVLHARVRGVRGLGTTIRYWESMLSRIAERPPAGLLVMDELVGEELAASEWKSLVATMTGRGLEGVPIAHVKPFALDQIDYCETYARESGLDARAFRDEGEALAWLRERG